MKRTLAMFTLAATASANAALAQGINIDFRAASGVPGVAYGAAPPQAGCWNQVPGPAAANPFDLACAMAATPVTIAGTGGAAGWFNSPCTAAGSGNQRLMDDFLDLGPFPFAPMKTFTISHLLPGNYQVYTYAWGADNPGLHRTLVDVNGAGAVAVGGVTCPFAFALGVTHSVHAVTVAAMGDVIQINLTPSAGRGRLNGIQIVPGGPGGPVVHGNDNPN